MITTHKNHIFTCVHCGDTGWISAVHRVHENQFAFRCGVCSAADRAGISKSIPLWTSGFKSSYETHKEWLTRKSKGGQQA